VEQLGLGSRPEGVEAFPEAALKLVGRTAAGYAVVASITNIGRSGWLFAGSKL
jgi:hypothetical protein